MNTCDTFLGIDIGGTNTVVGLVDKNGKCLETATLSTNAHRPFTEFFAQLEKVINPFQTDNKYCICGAGIGVPGANAENGRVEDPENFNWGKIDLAQIVRDKFDFPVSVINDANAAALGEMKYGKARDLKNFIQITLGTGLGSSMVVDGKIVNGHHGLAGELGHTRISRDNRKCSCGKRGCLETYVSAAGVCRTAFELMSLEKENSPLRKHCFNELTAEIVTEYAEQGDALAVETYRLTGQILGEKLADIIGVFDPEAILFSGGLTSAGKFLFDPMIKTMSENLLKMHRNAVKIIVSDNKKNYAVLGAALLIMQQLRMQ